MSPINSIASSTWSHTLNTELLYPFTLAHAFLPILATFAHDNQPQHSRWTSKHLPFLLSRMSQYFCANSARSSRPSLIVLSPIFPSLCSAYNALENVTFASTRAWLETLRAELAASHSSLRVIHLRLGAFDGVSAMRVSKDLILANRSNFETQRDESASQSSSDRPCDRNQSLPQIPSLKGSPLRELHNGIFDAIVGATVSRGGILYLGQGSLVYAMIGNLCPSTLIGWMTRNK